jgi:hypothetical protein
MEKEKKLGLFFFLAKCFQSMPKKEKFSKKNQRGPSDIFPQKRGCYDYTEV